MNFSVNRNILRWLIILASFIIISSILWNTYVFFQHFKAEERTKMENFTFAYVEFSKDLSNLDAEINKVAEKMVIDTTLTTPMLLLNSENKIISYRNVRGQRKFNDTINNRLDSIYVYDNLQKLIDRYNSENQPITIEFFNSEPGTLYYGNSPLLNKLKYYPLALLLIIFLFGAVVYFFYRSSKIATQNKLWTGMAKETAHQIGTPLSSLVGWTEILKSENVDPSYLVEIEKDINRLQTITDRFSKIGSVPTLEKTDIVAATVDSFEYLKARSSNLIQFEISTPKEPVFVDLNTQLYSWTIENLVKNAIDAMKGKGKLKLSIVPNDKFVKINVEDTGKGLPKNLYHKIFEPGFTSKKRGWGLGLSLAKRIIEDYHNGRIKVLHSEVGKGTTMQISLKIV